MKNNPNHQNLPDSFPELNFQHLQRYANRWAKNFHEAQIQIITLYRYSSKYQGNLGGEVSTKYFVVFEVSINYDNYEMYKIMPFAFRLHLGLFEPSYKPYEDLIFATQYRQAGSHDLLHLVDSSFQTTAYKGAARENFKYEWQFFPKGPNDKLPLGVMADEPFWSLYEGKEKQHQISARSKAQQVKGEYSQEVVDLLMKAKPEIEDLYKGIKANKRIPDVKNDETHEAMLKYAAEQFFDTDGYEYEIIKKKHVMNSHLYFSNTKDEVPDLSHPSRDFQGKLCQVLIYDIFSNKYISDLNSPPKGFGVKTLYPLLKSL